MEELFDWLQKPEYTSGVKLYERIGDNAGLKHQFQHGRPQRMFPYLIKEMKRLAAKITAKPSRFSVKAKFTPSRGESNSPNRGLSYTPVITPPSDPKFVSIEYEELVAYRREKFVEFARLRNSLTDIASDADRLKAVEKCEELFDINQRIWKAQDHYDKHGEWPEGRNPLAEQPAEPPKPTPTSPDELRAERERTRKRLGRAEDRLKAIAAKEGESSTAYLKKEQEVTELRIMVDMLTDKLRQV